MKDCRGIWESLTFPLAEGEGVLGGLSGPSLSELSFERRMEFMKGFEETKEEGIPGSRKSTFKGIRLHGR